MPDEPNPSPQEQINGIAHRNYRQKAYEKAAKTLVWIKSHLPPTPSNHVHTDHECNYRLEYAKYVVEVGTLFGLIVYVIINGRILGAMNAANHQSLKIFQATERPWISIQPSIVGPLVFIPSDGVQIQLRFCLHNWGQSPATHVDIVGSLTTPDALAFLGALSNERQMCEGMRNNRKVAVETRMLGNTIFPADESNSTETWMMTGDQIVKALKLKGFPGKTIKVVFPEIIGCVLYQFGETPYMTEFRYRLSHKEGSGIEPTGSVPPSDLKMTKAELGNDAY